jgi:hypothetical protein
MLLRRSAATAAIAAAFLALAPLAAAQSPQSATRGVPHTVAELAEICAIPQGAADYTAASFFCRGFLAGVGQYHGALHPVGSPRRPIFCVPDPPPTLLSAANAFVAWARANPQHGGEAAVDGLVRFAEQAWPCPTTPQRRR